MSSNQFSDTAILTVTFNSSRVFAGFISSAIESVRNNNQIFVVDNNSDDVKDLIELSSSIGFQLLELDQNIGYGAAINHVVQQLPERINTLIICNPDCVLNFEAINLLRSKVACEQIGVAGPKILNFDGTVYPSARTFPSLFNGIGHALFANIWLSNPWTKSYLSEAHLQNKTIPTGWVSGACIAVRRDLFTQVGGFDDHYFMYFEDVDLCYRLGKLGYTNLYVPEVSITHIGGESTKAIKKTMLRIHHESAMRFIQVKYKGILWAPVRGVIRLGLALRFWLQARKATT